MDTDTGTALLRKRLIMQRTKTIETRRVQRHMVLEDSQVIAIGEPQVTTKTVEDVTRDIVETFEPTEDHRSQQTSTLPPSKFYYFGTNIPSVHSKDNGGTNKPTILLPEMDNANDQLSTAETSEHHFGTKYKRTLDSDEEDDEVDAEKYNVLDNEEIEGMEKATVDFDGDIKITPFNMDEELETGHFDKEGTYIFEKQQDIHDNWLDNIDWTKVKGDENKDSDDDVEDKVGKKLVDANELYRQVLELIQPMESIQKAIQRYGKTIKRTKKGQPKWKKARNETKEEDKDDQQEKENKDKMMKLISIADQLLSETGDMEIYEKKYEEIQFNLKKSEPVSDMFGDDFDDEKNQGASTSRQ